MRSTAILAVIVSRASALNSALAVEKSLLDPAVEKSYGCCIPAGVCSYTSDGGCDDGGPGSDYSLCPFGSDGPDCPLRGLRCAAAGCPRPLPPPVPWWRLTTATASRPLEASVIATIGVVGVLLLAAMAVKMKKHTPPRLL